MVFLNPAVLIGMLAAAIPVLIHLLNLKRLKKIEFSTLAFLKELQKSKIRKIKLKQWLLLFLRVAIIALLVMAFARPTVKSVSFGSSAAKTSAVFVIDNSFSMSVIDEHGAFFNQAKSITNKLIDNLQDGDEISVVFTSLNQNEKMKFSTDFSSAKKQLEITELSDATIQLVPVLKNVLNKLENSNNFNKEIYFLSDFQRVNYFTKPEEQTHKFENLTGTRFYKIAFSPRNVSNLTITNFNVNNQIFELNKPVEFTVTVKNNSGKNVNNATVTLFINGKRRAHAGIKLNAGETKSYILTTTLKEQGLLEISAELDDDDILNDNKMYLGIYVPEKINVLLVTDKTDEIKFIDLALAPQIAQAVSLTKIKTTGLASVNFRNYDVVFLTEIPLSNYGLLSEYLTDGGSVILMPNSNSNLNEIQRFCKNLNLPVPEELTEQPDDPVIFDKIDLNHPVFTNLFRKDFKPKLDSPLIYKYIKIIPGGRGKSIIKLIDNSAFLSEFNLGKGKLMFFGVAPVLKWSDFPLKGIFAPLMNKLIYYLAAGNQKINTVKAGESIELNLRKIKIPQIKIVKPGTEEFVDLDLKKTQRYFNYGKTGKTGIYKFYSGDKLIDFYAVNFDPNESDLTVLNEDEFDSVMSGLGFDGKIIKLKPTDDFKNIIYQSRFGTELWRYFLIIALVLALLEMFISKSAKKDMQTIGKNN